jgi:hypothetical protein
MTDEMDEQVMKPLTLWGTIFKFQPISNGD